MYTHIIIIYIIWPASTKCLDMHEETDKLSIGYSCTLMYTHEIMRKTINLHPCFKVGGITFERLTNREFAN